MDGLTKLLGRASGDGERVASQGGIIQGSNPTEYNPKDPITIFIIQVRELELGIRSAFSDVV